MAPTKARESPHDKNTHNANEGVKTKKSTSGTKAHKVV